MCLLVSLHTPAAIPAPVGALGGSGCILSAWVMLCPASASPAALAHPVTLCCVSGRLASALAVGGSASAPPILSASALPLPAMPTLHRSTPAPVDYICSLSLFILTSCQHMAMQSHSIHAPGCVLTLATCPQSKYTCPRVAYTY